MAGKPGRSNFCEKIRFYGEIFIAVRDGAAHFVRLQGGHRVRPQREMPSSLHRGCSHPGSWQRSKKEMAAAPAKVEREEDRMYQWGAGAGNAMVEKMVVWWPGGVFHGVTLIGESAVTEREGRLEKRFTRNRFDSSPLATWASPSDFYSCLLSDAEG